VDERHGRCGALGLHRAPRCTPTVEWTDQRRTLRAASPNYAVRLGRRDAERSSTCRGRGRFEWADDVRSPTIPWLRRRSSTARRITSTSRTTRMSTEQETTNKAALVVPVAQRVDLETCQTSLRTRAWTASSRRRYRFSTTSAGPCPVTRYATRCPSKSTWCVSLIVPTMPVGASPTCVRDERRTTTPNDGWRPPTSRPYQSGMDASARAGHTPLRHLNNRAIWDGAPDRTNWPRHRG